MHNLQSLFVKELKDAYDNESEIVKELPHFINAVSSPELKSILQSHLTESKQQMQTLQTIAKELNVTVAGGTCYATRGILKEGKEAMQGFSGPIKDASIIMTCQKVEHYEIALYGCLKTFASHLQLKNVEHLLNNILREEKDADHELSEIAEGNAGINVKATLRKSA